MSDAENNSRRGFALAGNWIVDHLKIVDVWPSPGSLANILSEQMGTGGAPLNVLLGLARLDPSLPLEAIGLIGDDDDGRWIMETIKPLASDTSALKLIENSQTSYTDVMTVEATGERTFFHLRGANSDFDVRHVPIQSLKAKIFHLGYLLLLTRLDKRDKRYGTRAAGLLAECQKAGLMTSIDVVSAEGGLFEQIVTPALHHTDYCIVNEVEAGGIASIALRDASDKPDWNAIEDAAGKLVDLGVKRNVTIHLPEGALSLDVAAGVSCRVDSLPLPDGFVKGAAGAGDAFCSGMLLGLHEEWPIEKSLRVAHAAAAASLRHPTCNGALASLDEATKLAETLEGGRNRG